MQPLGSTIEVASRPVHARPARGPVDLQLASAQWPPPDRSGDFLHVRRDPEGGTTIFLGDVSGNGARAAPLAARAGRLLGRHLHRPGDLGGLLQSFNDDLEQTLTDDLFVTAVAARIDTRRRTLRLASAGHLGPFLRARTGCLSLSRPSGPPLGIRAGTQYGGEVVFDLTIGDLLVFATDGVSDRFATHADPTGEDGLLTSLDRLSPDPSSVCRRLLGARPPSTDATVVAVKLTR
jgi:serine phosphatase RsbU (regulator of sigma subunit)